MERLELNNGIIEYEIKISTKAKRIRITIKNGNVIVTVPKGVSTTQARQFIETKQEWVKRHIQGPTSNKHVAKREYACGDKFPYMGILLELKTQNTQLKRIKVQREENVMMVSIPDFIVGEKRKELIKNSIMTWYKNEAKRVFKYKLDYYSQVMDLEYNRLRVKNQRTRWGSCSSKKNINLNWKILLAPNDVIDYIIIHELTHMKYMNHSQEFWQSVARYIPEYTSQKRWLKENGKNLSIEYY